MRQYRRRDYSHENGHSHQEGCGGEVRARLRKSSIDSAPLAWYNGEH